MYMNKLNIMEKALKGLTQENAMNNYILHYFAGMEDDVKGWN